MIKSAIDLQRLKLEKLMKNPDKPVVIPEHRREKDYMASVPTFVRNVMGSSAGAGSGEFHVYRHLRRKEYARQKMIQQKSLQEQLDDEYQQKIEENRRKAEEKTAKKRAKRLKKKQRAKKARQQKPSGDATKCNEDDNTSSDCSDDNEDNQTTNNENDGEPTSLSSKEGEAEAAVDNKQSDDGNTDDRTNNENPNSPENKLRHDNVTISESSILDDKVDNVESVKRNIDI
uniref:PRKR-interacting protein 1 n=1 Tax=Musca domestica TaxID=7370 RepID=T1PJN3_MUSDO